MKLNKTYLTLTILLLSIEISIAVFLKSGFIRHTFGDYLSVILLYCFFKSFIANNHYKIAIYTLIVAYVIEFLQLINILEILNLQDYKLINIIMGNTFHISDLVAYSLGTISVLIIENFRLKKQSNIIKKTSL
ncbi:DUF2809 domain-containing protein [uncultured Algibacter sp.]|uniref:ribosomal maturation YjgA family protein n=1 Tax=uncultured Algibacter sp. TaxID=298659 RepID=UPI003217EEA2